MSFLHFIKFSVNSGRNPINKMAKITVQAHPGAKRNEVIRYDDGVWHIKVAAPPVEGKANKKLIDYLSEVLDVPKAALPLRRAPTANASWWLLRV